MTESSTKNPATVERGEVAKPSPEWGSLQAFVRAVGPSDATVRAVVPLGVDDGGDTKAFGYGAPLRVRFDSRGIAYDWVFRTVKRDEFGHDRPEDAWAALVGARTAFARIPEHVRPRALGVLTADGERFVVPEGAPFLVTELAPGEPYARDLEALAEAPHVEPRDLARAERLANYLADLHSEPGSPAAYRRAIRDLVGDGEGVFGLSESYPEHDPIAPRPRLQALERRVLEWRWKLFDRAHRARRIHADFHPFNLLFDDRGALHVLDASRGVTGEPADDVCALAINYLYFGLRARGELVGALRAVWERFWTTYLDRAQDPELLELVAPFFAWRALVLASPVWYPNETLSTRDTLLTFAESLLSGEHFDPGRVDEVLR